MFVSVYYKPRLFNAHTMILIVHIFMNVNKLCLNEQSEEAPHAAISTARPTLRASLSGTLLQTLPDLVTPLKGYSLSPRSCPATRSAPSERFGY